ncbi:hypothetical protein F4821DRAFT_241291 [Hypoxylon rubiginosum]|uniref:Uncharacterized protein n=1 Tax=Hypoxylon rubiginosum TaxID=110542 RepID=A0ACC0CXX5_9PEZI|nr:hypothetical protein F4821DRAFT_241291 [Hypoxylon rubiginosum]
MELSSRIEPYLSPLGLSCLRLMAKSFPLNPRNWLDSFRSARQPLWHVDGCTALGRQFLAVLIFMLPGLPVKRIYVIISCQSQHPHPLRHALQSAYTLKSPNMA